MSPIREKHAKDIADQLNTLAAMVKTHSRAGLGDANHIAETIIEILFNKLFGWNLVNLNTEQTSYPAVDLADDNQRVAIQVTCQDDPSKIKKTIINAGKYNLADKYNRLIIFFLLPKKPNYEFSQPSNGLKIEVWDIADLLKIMLELDLTVLERASRTLAKEMGLLPQPGTEARFDISRILKYAPAQLIGREEELKLLNDSWDKVIRDESHHSRVLTFVALGGEGKTSLVAKWAAGLSDNKWPGCDAAFAWSFYSQGTREQQAASSDVFLKEALTFFGDEQDKAFAASPAGAFEKGQRLARLVGQRRSLLILDGLEPLQYAPTAPTPGELKDQGVAALLKGLAAASHGLCVVTTRYALPDLRAFLGKTVREETLTRLSRDAGVALLKAHGVAGSDRKNVPLKPGDAHSEQVSEFEKLVEDVDGHALTLHLMGSFLKRFHRGDIRCRDRVTFEKASQKTDNHHAFRAMAAYAKSLADGSDEAKRELALLHLLGLFDRPATADCLAALLQAPVIPGLTESLAGVAEEELNGSLTSLVEARLLTQAEETVSVPASHFPLPAFLDAHPLLREYFAVQLKWGAHAPSRAVSDALVGNISGEPGAHESSTRPDQPAGARVGTREGACAPQTSEAWRAGHRRLYEHLCASTHEGDAPTLEALQPLYQAVAHGCQAGLQREVFYEVYYARIKRRGEHYSAYKLGALGADLGATAYFFEQPWLRLSASFGAKEQSFIFNFASFYLRALGRLAEALEPMRAALSMGVEQEDWKSAAIRASNLSELEVTLGEVAQAERDAAQSVTYADRSGDAFWKMGTRTTHADALHQAGRRAEAEARFREAEQMQAESQPEYPLLYSQQGFIYCDLLLTEAERAAWETVLGSARASRAVSGALAGNIAALPDIRESPARSGQSAGAPIGAREGACAPLLESCRAVSQRAAQALEIVLNGSRNLLDIALNHLTLGRAALYAAILERGSGILPLNPDEKQRLEAAATLETSRRELDAAVTGLRRAGTTHHIPRGLLTRAWLRFLAGQATGPESAQEDLDEAWEIAERGPMKLFMADIHLHRARLFFREKPYPWKSPQDDFAAAEKLINDCGYHRRDEELADAKEKTKSWSESKPDEVIPSQPPEQQPPPPTDSTIAVPTEPQIADGKRRLVILVHGIRTRAEWLGRIRHLFEAGGRTFVEAAGYEYFDVVRFLCPFWTRRKPVEVVLKKIRAALVLHENKFDELVIMAHSFGTYIVGRILRENSDMRPDRLLLCGSVLPASYAWDQLPNRPEAVLNEAGSRDIWPILAKSVTWGYGSTGTFGFQTPGVRDRFHNLAHSDYFKVGFAEKYWVPWIQREVVETTPYEISSRPPTPLYKNLLEVFPLKWLGTLIALAMAISVVIYPHSQRTAGTRPQPAEERIVITTPPENIWKVFEGKTSYEADNLIKTVYLGKWLEIRSTISDVGLSSEPLGAIYLTFKPINSAFHAVYAYFDKPWERRLNHIPKGQVVGVRGRIVYIDESWIRLSQCELIDRNQ